MKSLLVAIFLLITFSFLLGQDNMADYRIVYLKDGSVLKGLLDTSFPADDGVSLQIVTGEKIVLSNNLITKVVKPKKKLHYISEGRSIQPKGRFYAVHLNVLSNYSGSISGKETDPRLDIGFHFVAGHKFSEKHALGIGIGLDQYPEQVMLPLFLDYRGVLSKQPSRFAFAYNLMIGHSLQSGLKTTTLESGKRSGGILVYPNIGIRIARKSSSNILLDVGYKFQYTELEYTTWGWWSQAERTNIDKRWFNSLTFRIGLEF